MLAEHHSLTIDATYELLDFWNENEESEVAHLVDIRKIKGVTQQGGTGGVEIKSKDLRRWVAQADYIEDIDLPAELTEFIISIFGNPTRFQHFAYCHDDALGEGTAQVNKYDGYCWDCDLSIPDFFKRSANSLFIKAIRRIIPIGKINVIRKYLGQNVKYSSYLYPLCNIFFQKSPCTSHINGVTVWHDQKYPSAVEMAKFYGDGANDFKNNGSVDWAVKSLGFAIHMLQDIGIYHHVFCKLLDKHSSFEEKTLKIWESHYKNSNVPANREISETTISSDVKGLLKVQLQGANSFEKLGKKLVDIMSQRFQSTDTTPEANVTESRKITAQGIACTIKAIELFS